MNRFLIAIPVAVLAWVSAAAQPPASRAPEIPLREGLTIVTAYGDVRGDLESIKRITAADAKTLRVAYSTDLPADENNPLSALLGGCEASHGGRDQKTVRATVARIVRREDLESAHEYRFYFSVCSPEPESFPASTAIGVSAAVLRELKATGRTRLNVPAAGVAGGLGAIMGLLGRGGPTVPSSLESGALERVERGTVAFATLVNDQPAELSAVHARGQLGEHAAEFWILDDAANPLALRWSIGEQRLQVIKVSYPPLASVDSDRIEQDLAKQGRAVIYGIYFDFSSDRLKPESDVVLADIAAVLRKNPTWAVAVEGHTDRIGGDASNMDLSKRRAAAVKLALVNRYKIDGQRLQTAGYGASRPKDTNDTLQGRARNRRVELVKPI